MHEFLSSVRFRNTLINIGADCFGRNCPTDFMSSGIIVSQEVMHIFSYNFRFSCTLMNVVADSTLVLLAQYLALF